MAIAPYYWPRAPADAPIHLQIRLTKRPAGSDTTVGGKIVRIFRDDTQRLRRGQRISFAVNWRDSESARDDGPVFPMPGRQSFPLDRRWLEAARFLGAYLAPACRDGKASDQGEVEVVWDQVTALRKATDEPVNPADSEGFGVFVTEDVLRHAAPGQAGSIFGWLNR